MKDPKRPAVALLGLFLLLTSAALAAAPSKKAAPPAPLPDYPLLPLASPKVVSQGVYKDGAGAAHDWRISEGHVLEWEGTPYLPVGGAFTPQFWADGQTDASWEQDKKALETLKKSGVQDVYLYAGQRGLTRIPTAAVQRVLDYLDANGFRYGIEIADFPGNPLVGYVVKPSVYRDPGPPSSGPVQFKEIAGLANAFYVVASPQGEIDEIGAARVVDKTTAVADVNQAPVGDVLLLYPQRLFLDGSPESHLPDLWQGYDEYRDRLLAYFTKLKLGPGFRFFLDPLTDKIGVNGEVENLVPTSDGFRLDFQAWLGKKYKHGLDDINRAWAVKDHSLEDFAVAARCLPLWYQSKGVLALFDPVAKTTMAVEKNARQRSRFWDDLAAFRTDSVRGYMNAVADALKKGVANVPVVYKWTGQSQLFAQSERTRGFDGLGMEAYGHGRALSVDSGAYTFAQAEDAPKTTWLIVSGTGETARPADQKTPGYASRASLFNDWDYLKEIGARGFFTQALQRLPEDQWANVNLVSQPEQLGWLASYAASLQSAPLVGSAPRPLWYPAGATALDIGIRALPDGIWWLPTFRPGAALNLGSDLSAYALPGSEGRLPTYVVWSPRGTMTEARFVWGKDAQPIVGDPNGTPVKIARKDDVWTVPVGKTPILIGRVKSMPLPLDVVEAAEKEVARLLKMADAQKIQTQEYKDQVFHALNVISNKPADAQARYSVLSRVITVLTSILQPYTWIEAEAATPYTFDSLAPNPEASGGAYLALDTDRRPPPALPDRDGGYRAEYKFAVNAPGRYTLWMSGSPLGTPDVSPFTYKIDGGAANEVRGADTEGAAYAGKFVWSKLGELDLLRGSHTLSLVVTARRPADNHYTLAIDAFCLSRVPFHPDGPRQPPIDTLPPPDVKTADDKKAAR